MTSKFFWKLSVKVAGLVICCLLVSVVEVSKSSRFGVQMAAQLPILGDGGAHDHPQTVPDGTPPFGAAGSHLEQAVVADPKQAPPSLAHGRARPPPKFPRLCILIGAMKGGTEAFSNYLEEHPHVVPSFQYETHYFNNFPAEWESSGDPESGRGARIKYVRVARKRYRELFPAWDGGAETVQFEKTPAYLFHAHVVARRIREVVPWAQLVVLLRDPVERAYSHYKMVYANSPFHQKREVPFQEMIKLDLQQLRGSGLLDYVAEMAPLWADPATDPRDPSYDALERRWEDYLRAHPHPKLALVGRGLYFVQLRYFCVAFRKEGRPMEEVLLPLRSEDMEPADDGTVPLLGAVTDFLSLPPLRRGEEGAQRYHGQDRVAAPAMTAEMRRELRELYAPCNGLLGVLFGGAWASPWDYSDAA